jgi:predicted DCC family thiol-disulfide oxidoreductase YuxK
MGAQEITVIYDGQCQLCQNAISWVSKKIVITALDFHTADLAQLQLSEDQCAREVFVIAEGKRHSGAQAVAFLLKVRGNTFLSALITLSGPLARFGYRWVAGNRNSWPVKILSSFLKG